MNSIWITSIGGDIAQAAIRIIRREFPKANIIGSDAIEQPFFSKFVDEFVLTPMATCPNFILELSRELKERSPDILIPVSEQEILALTLNSEMFSHTNILIPNKQTVEVGLDKWATYEFISAIGDFVPFTSRNFNPLDFNFPVITKPRKGRGSKNIYICQDIQDIRYFESKHPLNIFQEILLPVDQEITCAVYRSKIGEIRILQLKRKLVSGRTSWAEVVVNHQIEELCTRIAESIQLRGPLNVQLILTASGPKVFEINPRYSSTVELRHALGFQDLIWGIQELEGKSISKLEPITSGILCGKLDSAVVFRVES